MRLAWDGRLGQSCHVGCADEKWTLRPVAPRRLGRRVPDVDWAHKYALQDLILAFVLSITDVDHLPLRVVGEVAKALNCGRRGGVTGRRAAREGQGGGGVRCRTYT